MQWFAHPWEFASWMLRALPMPPAIDIVHTSSVLAHAFAKRGTPCVVTEHQFVRHPEFKPWRGRLQRIYHGLVIGPAVTRSLRRADRIVSVSHHVADAMEAEIHRPVDVVHNWVDADAFRPRDGFIRRGDGPLRWTLSELALFLEGNELVARVTLSPPAWERGEQKLVFE